MCHCQPSRTLSIPASTRCNGCRHVLPPGKTRNASLDLPGVVLGSATLLGLLLLVNQLPHAGINALTGSLLAAAPLTAALFIWREASAREPMLNLALFKSPVVALGSASALLNYVSQYVLVFLTPFYLKRILLYPPDKVGLIMTAGPLAVMASAPLSGALSDRIGTARLAALGAGLCALGLTAMSRLAPETHPVDVIWRLALFGLGTGIFQSPNNSAVMGAVPPAYLGIASGVLASMRNIGMALGVAMSGAILYVYVAPDLLHSPTLDGGEATAFIIGLRRAYIAGALATGLASALSIANAVKRPALIKEI